MQLPPIATTTIGSFPRPGWLADPSRDQVTLLLAGEALGEAQDDATLLVLHEQELVGLDLLTDGEQRRTNFIHHALSGLDGVDVVNRRMKEIRRRAGNESLVPRIVGPVRRRASITVEDTRFAKANTERPVKMAVPGPVTVVDSTYDEFYGDEAALAMDVAAAINAELLEMQAAGCDVLQIDEP
ncbi:MAG: 5-methyltetrahydropteroyltriglutamate--homocysteine methyltransferase, partial [Chloroflexota bacterium]|nr:5-methyltetrahydropteroyltriglutamate--homocysteine methyltransferase [Chloroflexota bacterium]